MQMVVAHMTEQHTVNSLLVPQNSKCGEDSGMTKRTVQDYFDTLAPQWDKHLEVDMVKINRILDIAGVCAGSRVLDVACGTGVLFPFYAQRNAALVTAVDISPEMAKIAAAKVEKDRRFQVICADIESLETTGGYDCCVIYNAFPHFPEPGRLVEGLAPRLSPGGRLTVAHSMSLEQLTRHHAGRAAKVSREMLPAQELAALLAQRFRVDNTISDHEKYIVSGVVLPPEEWRQ